MIGLRSVLVTARKFSGLPQIGNEHGSLAIPILFLEGPKDRWQVESRLSIEWSRAIP